MISSEQIRGARGLLGWSQLDLARNCHLSKTAINNIERNLVNPRSSTLAIIRATLEGYGVEFLGELGVNLKRDIFNVSSEEGERGFANYLADITRSLRGTNEISLHFNVDDQLLVDIGFGDVMHKYYEEMRRFGLRDKVLVQEGDLVRYGPPDVSDYAWLPKNMFSVTGYSIYGNKYVIFILEGEKIRTVTIENASVADVFRKQFEGIWALCKPQPTVKSLYEKNQQKGVFN